MSVCQLVRCRAERVLGGAELGAALTRRGLCHEKEGENVTFRIVMQGWRIIQFQIRFLSLGFSMNCDNLKEEIKRKFYCWKLFFC